MSSFGSGRGAGVGPLRLIEQEAPHAPAPAGSTSTPCSRASAARTWPPWTGAARATSRTSSPSPSSRGTRWWAPCRRTPRRPTVPRSAAGSRVVLQPVLGCAARGIEPPCPACQAGHVGNCGNLAFGHIRPGLQTGFCADTGGGWSSAGTGGAPEPALRGARRAQRRRRGHGGAGGLRGARGPRRAHRPGRRGGHPRRRHARTLGDRRPDPPGHDRSLCHAVGRARRRPLRAPAAAGPRVRRHRGPPARPAAPGRAPPRPLHVVRRALGGDRHAVGRRRRGARLRGQRRVHRPVARHGAARGAPSLSSACPARCTWTWRRSGTARSAWPAPTPTAPSATRSQVTTPTFALALELAAAKRTGQLVSATYPLTRFEDAVVHAGAAGRRGSVKIAFDVAKGHAR